MKLAVIYALLAAIATVCNIAAQDIVIRTYLGHQSLLFSLIVGTGVGLGVKYVLDKRYIFRFQAQNAAHDGRTFLLYALMGVATTTIFWGFEFAFEYAFASKEMRYLGGVIGLTIGYVAKYELDKRFVFRTAVARC